MSVVGTLGKNNLAVSYVFTLNSFSIGFQTWINQSVILKSLQTAKVNLFIVDKLVGNKLNLSCESKNLSFELLC